MASDYDVSSLIEDSVSPLRANDIDPNEAIKDPDKVVQMVQDRQYGPPAEKLPSLINTSQSTGRYTPSASEVPMATAGTQPTQPTDWSSLMNGASSPAPASSAAGSTVSNGQPTEDPDLVNARNLAQKSQQRTDQIQANYDANAKRIQDLEAQRSQKAVPIDPKGTSATTGKSYNPSVGRRILRGVLGGVEGFAKGGFNGALLGAVDPKAVTGTAYGAPTAQYGRDVAKQQGELSSLDQQIKTTEQQQKDQYEAGRSLGTDTNANARVFADIATAKKNAATADQQKTLADIRQQQEDERERNNQSRNDTANNLNDIRSRMNDIRLRGIEERVNKGQGGGNSDARQALISQGDDQVAALGHDWQYDPGSDKWVGVGANNQMQTISPEEYTDHKQKIVDQVNRQLTAKKMPPIQARFNPDDARDPKYRKGTQAQPSAPTAQNDQPKPSGKPKSGTVIAPAPAGKKEGTTGTLPDGTKVVIKGGKVVAL
jgi:hypothetical protein